ncbi:hypothetical protein KXW63_009245 [Aspergillus fumigatus]|nr:hypothetical protein KXW63_009245 [Aspergillus fumigatus]
MSRASNPAIKCAEDIAIALLFHNVPAPPSSNSMHRISEGQYVLSLDQERKLAGTLAFLAHNREGAEYVPAVCIGEDSATGSLNVIFAVNKANYSDGNNVLRSIQKSFDEIFALLARVSTDRSPSLKDQVFYMVVSMCSSRILSRLRLGSPGQDKLKDRDLLEAVSLLSTRAKEARKAADLWSRHQVAARLIELVESIYRIQQIEQLQPIVDMIPNDYMEPTARESFMNIVGKKVPLARNMRTVPVQLPQEAFATPSVDTYTPNLLIKVTEASAKGRQQKLLKEICRALGLSEQQASDQYCLQKGSDNTDAGPPAHETASFQPELNQTPDRRESMGSVKRSECTNFVSDQPDKIFGNVGPKETSEPYSAGPLEIVIESITGSSSHSYCIEWLDDREAKEAREKALLIDVEEINEEITLCEQNPLILKRTAGEIDRLLHDIECQIQSNHEKEQRRHEEVNRIFQSICNPRYEEGFQWLKDQRFKCTGHWIFKHQQFQNWVTTKKGLVLWIDGILGAGKSVLTSQIIERLQGNQDTVVYFFSGNGPARWDLRSIIQCFVAQLAVIDQKNIPRKLLEAFRRSQETGGRAELFSVDTWEQFLAEMLLKQPKPCLVIDGLDAFNLTLQSDLLGLITKLRNKCNQLRVLVSSRESQNIRSGLKDKLCIDLSTLDRSDEERAVIQAKFDSVNPISDKDRAFFIDKIMQKSHGYRTCKYAHRAFKFMMASPVRVSSQLIIAAVFQDEDNGKIQLLPKDVTNEYIIKACSCFLLYDQRTDAFDFSHRSAWKYLKTQFSAETCNLYLARLSLKILRKTQKCDKAIAQKPPFDCIRPIVIHSAGFWFLYVRSLGNKAADDSQLQDLLREFLQPRGTQSGYGWWYKKCHQFGTEIMQELDMHHRYAFSDVLSSPPSPWFLVGAFGLSSIIETLTKQPELDVNGVNEADETGFSLAIKHHHVRTTQALLHRRVHVRPRDFSKALQVGEDMNIVLSI